MSLSKKNKLILIVLVIGFLAGFFVFNLLTKPPENIESRTISFDGEATVFINKIQSDFTKWQDKVVLLKGKITTKDENGITLENTIYCQFRKDTKFTSLKINQPIVLKGRVIGYDDMLEELKLDQCILPN